MDPAEDILQEVGERIKEESKATKVAKWIYKHSTLIFSVFAALFAFSVFFLFNPEYTAKGLSAFAELMGKVHSELSKPRFGVYQVAGLIAFLTFMTLMTLESAKARTIRIISARNPEREIYVRVKPLIGVKLPFLPERKVIKPMIIETEYGYIVYPSKSLLNAQWNGEKHFIPKHARLSFGNVWVIAGYPPDKPTWVEKVETSKGVVDVDFYEWEVDSLGEILVERLQRNIDTLMKENKVLKEYLMTGWKFAEDAIVPIKERFDRMFEDNLEKVEKIGKLFVQIEAERERTARKILSAVQDKRIVLGLDFEENEKGEVESR